MSIPIGIVSDTDALQRFICNSVVGERWVKNNKITRIVVANNGRIVNLVI